ncbi:hypothetical protein FW774_10265 [Pedobacter sp. BS3]|uniref:hypothetical protein n=1 Tax=Pedobacter sp. BS3 TaxID=2567937 RepID=UPI0011EF0FC3|nr:hypothetical protein [Pedobacter sp. BS3]TZF83839.1 hypothetical protein FW774_10265 [Pedobacter sp. BS3]
MAANDWSEIDKQKTREYVDFLIGNIGDERLIAHKNEVADCFLDKLITEYPRVEDMKQALPDNKDHFTKLMAGCFSEYGVNIDN